MNKEIGLKIRELRRARGYSQEELAKLVGYNSRAVISQIELGQLKVSADKALLFAQVFGVPITYLLGNEDTNSRFAQDYVADVFELLNDEGKKLAREYIEMLMQSGKYNKKQ